MFNRWSMFVLSVMASYRLACNRQQPFRYASVGFCYINNNFSFYILHIWWGNKKQQINIDSREKNFTKMVIILFFLFVFPPVCGYLPYTYPPSFSPFFSLPFFIPCQFLPYRQLPPMRMRPQPFFPMLYRICTRAQGNCGKPVPIQSAI